MRHLLFTKFDRGILLDTGNSTTFCLNLMFLNNVFLFTESFYSVCPEVLSYHIAKRCKNNIVLDPFCGAGGNIIQLAKTCKRGIIITMLHNILLKNKNISFNKTICV